MIEPHLRAIIAATAISHATGRDVSSIFQYGNGSGYRTVSVKISNNRVTAFDYSKSAHFTGNLPNLYHYGERCHVQFRDEGGGKYKGFVYGVSHHFEVTVRGNRASFFDYGGSGYTEFSA